MSNSNSSNIVATIELSPLFNPSGEGIFNLDEVLRPALKSPTKLESSDAPSVENPSDVLKDIALRYVNRLSQLVNDFDPDNRVDGDDPYSFLEDEDFQEVISSISNGHAAGPGDWDTELEELEDSIRRYRKFVPRTSRPEFGGYWGSDWIREYALRVYGLTEDKVESLPDVVVERPANPEIDNLPQLEIKLKHWCHLYWRNDNNPNWTRAFGFVLPCCCDDGEYHLTLPESEERCVCVKRDDLRVVNYT